MTNKLMYFFKITPSFLEHLMALICAVSLLVGCSTIKYIPIEGETIYKEIVKDTTIYVEVPKETFKEVCPDLDTLYMETSLASSKAFLDTNTRTLQGCITNKPIKLEKEIQIVEKEVKVETEIPIEVKVPEPYVPSFYKFCLWWFIGTLLLIILGIVWKIIKKIEMEEDMLFRIYNIKGYDYSLKDIKEADVNKITLDKQ